MDEVSAKQRQIISRVVIIALVLAALALIFGRFPAVWGILMGAAMAILNFRLLALSIMRYMDMTPSAARVQAGVRYAIRYLLTALFLFSVYINDGVDLYAAVVGLLLIKIVILGEAILTSINMFIQRKLNDSLRDKGGK